MFNLKLPSPITILMIIIVFAGLCTWLIPAGKYDTLTYSKDTGFTLNSYKKEINLPFTQHSLDSLHLKILLNQFANGEIKKPVSIPNTYHKLDSSHQNFLDVLQAPVKGVNQAIDIIFFILMIGAFMQIFNTSGAMEQGLKALSYSMKGREAWLIITLTFLFSFAGASYGMAEEGFAFYTILIPVFIAAGYDLIVPVAVIFGGTNLGTLASFTNPFSTIIASNAAGINWKDGIAERLLMFAITTIITIWYIVRYANKVKKNPTYSIIYKVDGILPTKTINVQTHSDTATTLSPKTLALLLIFLATFLTMVAGVVWRGWWLKEMTTIFLAAAILVAVILRMKENFFIAEFLKGAESLLGVAIILGVARGITIVLNDGNISDSIVYYAAKTISSMPSSLFIIMAFFMFILFTFFISSSSGMAMLTMPIIGSLAIMVGVPGREIVNAYLFGMGIMGFITPSGLILPSLALVNVSFKAWLKFIIPLLIILTLICAACLLIGIHF